MFGKCWIQLATIYFSPDSCLTRKLFFFCIFFEMFEIKAIASTNEFWFNCNNFVLMTTENRNNDHRNRKKAKKSENVDTICSEDDFCGCFSNNWKHNFFSLSFFSSPKCNWAEFTLNTWSFRISNIFFYLDGVELAKRVARKKKLDNL